LDRKELGLDVTNGALRSLHPGGRVAKGGEGNGRKTASAFGTILGRRQRSSVDPDADVHPGVGACLAEVNEERKSTKNESQRTDRKKGIRCIDARAFI
jgi:hypothetical protein